jgi:DNA-directed RNA polymerase subunit E'/Rpb7
MEHTALFEERASLSPRDLRGQVTDIDALLLQKLSTRMENKCSRHGFVLPGTMKILSRSMGYIEKGRFTGDIMFHLQVEGRVLNPPAGFILEGIVIRKNKMGMYISYDDAIRIILPRDIHIGDDAFEAIQIGDRVKVEVQKSRFQVNDAYILSVGLFRGLAASAAPVAAEVSVTEEVAEEAPVAEEVAEEAPVVEEMAEEEEAKEEDVLEVDSTENAETEEENEDESL